MTWTWIPAISYPFPWLIQSCSVSFMVEIKVSWKLPIICAWLNGNTCMLNYLIKRCVKFACLSILMTSLHWPILSLHCVYIVLASYHYPYISSFFYFRHHDVTMLVDIEIKTCLHCTHISCLHRRHRRYCNVCQNQF